MEDFSKQQTAEFNMAVMYLNRLNTLLCEMDKASAMLEMEQWYHLLRVFYKELSGEIKDEDRKSFKEKMKSINTLLINKNANYYPGVTSNLYESLEELEVSLRDIMRDSGLQMKYGDDASKALR